MHCKQSINRRIDDLRMAYAWSLETNSVLTTFQRICLNQERAALLRCLAILKVDEFTTVKPDYVIPKHLNEKVKHIITIISNTNWKKTVKKIKEKQ